MTTNYRLLLSSKQVNIDDDVSLGKEVTWYPVLNP